FLMEMPRIGRETICMGEFMAPRSVLPRMKSSVGYLFCQGMANLMYQYQVNLWKGKSHSASPLGSILNPWNLANGCSILARTTGRTFLWHHRVLRKKKGFRPLSSKMIKKHTRHFHQIQK